MTELLVVIVVGLAVIAGATVLGPRLGVASPLVLVAVGVAASFLPMVGDIRIDPEWILEGILPPLLYSSAVSLPSMNFRREFGAISGLSVVLVLATSLVLGLFFMVAIPELGFAWGAALGAIISPTDAVATSIVKGTATSPRAIAMLDGESLLNDATALVLLRTAIVAAAATFSFWGAVGSFAYSVAVAAVIGALVGWLNLVVRRRVNDATVNTVISFAVPFVAAVPVTLLGASGLVAAVVAGLVTGVRAPRDLSAQNRLSDAQNWRTVELVLEGAVFLLLGLQLRQTVVAVEEQHAGVGTAVLIAAGALALTLAVRTVYVAILLGSFALRRRQLDPLHERIIDMQERMSTPEGAEETLERMRRGRSRRPDRELDRFRTRLTRGLASLEYFRRQPLGWRDGFVVVWAGMRGAVTVAAAQTLPEEETPQRAVLVLVAFSVAILSLLVQGGTIGPIVRRLTVGVDTAAGEAARRAELDRLLGVMRTAAEAVEEEQPGTEDRSPAAFERARRYRLAVLGAQREVLLAARDDGTFDAEVLEDALATLDAAEIGIELRGRLAGPPSG